jgi:hypothetical protein
MEVRLDEGVEPELDAGEALRLAAPVVQPHSCRRLRAAVCVPGRDAPAAAAAGTADVRALQRSAQRSCLLRCCRSCCWRIRSCRACCC